MKNARIIVVLVLLALSLSGCANAGHSEVSAPSLQETVTAEPVQSTVPQGSTAVSVSGSTEVSAESMVEPEMKEAQPEVSTPEKEETPPTVSRPTETTPPKASEPEPSTEPTETQPQEPELPAEEEPTEPSFDIQTWIDYAKAYAESVGLRLESSAVDCWDTLFFSFFLLSFFLPQKITSYPNRPLWFYFMGLLEKVCYTDRYTDKIERRHCYA